MEGSDGAARAATEQAIGEWVVGALPRLKERLADKQWMGADRAEVAHLVDAVEKLDEMWHERNDAAGSFHARLLAANREVERLRAFQEEVAAYVAEGMTNPHEERSLQDILDRWAT